MYYGVCYCLIHLFMQFYEASNDENNILEYRRSSFIRKPEYVLQGERWLFLSARR